MKKTKKIFLILILFLVAMPVHAADCDFTDFFAQEYARMLNRLSIGKDKKELLDIVYAVYDGKFAGLETEYDREFLRYQYYQKFYDKKQLKAQKKNIDHIANTALDEFDSFIEDLNYEVYQVKDCERDEIKKAQKKRRKELSKLIECNCKKK